MTDIRTAAQRESVARVKRIRELAGFADEAATWFMPGFEAGAVWAAARVTPTREQIAGVVAAALERWLTTDDRHDARDRETVVADAVLALMQELAEGESSEQTH